MRKLLKQFLHKRRRFRATFVRYGFRSSKKGTKVQTVLFREIKDVKSGMLVDSHVWLDVLPTLRVMNPQEGEIFEFEATVREYTKGYKLSYGKWDMKALQNAPPEKDYCLEKVANFTRKASQDDISRSHGSTTTGTEVSGQEVGDNREESA